MKMNQIYYLSIVTIGMRAVTWLGPVLIVRFPSVSMNSTGAGSGG